MSEMKISSTASWQETRQTQTNIASQVQEKRNYTQDLYEKMKEAREKAAATREKFEKVGKPPSRYGDAPIEAHSRLARAKNASEVNAAAGYARRQITRLKAAKRTDPDNAKRIQAAINQLQKAVNRAGKKKQDLAREKVAQARQKKAAQEKKVREAQRQRHELRQKQAMRKIRESGYIREAEIDNRMQTQLAATQMELQKQAQSITSALHLSVEAVAQQYAVGSAAAAPETAAGGEINVQA